MLPQDKRHSQPPDEGIGHPLLEDFAMCSELPVSTYVVLRYSTISKCFEDLPPREFKQGGSSVITLHDWDSIMLGYDSSISKV